MEERPTVKSVRVVVAESNLVAREAIAVEVGNLEGIDIVATTAGTLPTMENVRALRPDLVVLSPNMGAEDAVALFDRIRREFPEMDVLIFDTIYRVGNVSDENVSKVSEIASFVVATQLVPKISQLYSARVGSKRG